MTSKEFCSNQISLMVFYFTNSVISLFGSRIQSFTTSINQETINFYTFNKSCNEFLSVQNTYWDDGDELSVVNQTLKILVSLG